MHYLQPRLCLSMFPVLASVSTDCFSSPRQALSAINSISWALPRSSPSLHPFGDQFEFRFSISYPVDYKRGLIGLPSLSDLIHLRTLSREEVRFLGAYPDPFVSFSVPMTSPTFLSLQSVNFVQVSSLPHTAPVPREKLTPILVPGIGLIIQGVSQPHCQPLVRNRRVIRSAQPDRVKKKSSDIRYMWIISSSYKKSNHTYSLPKLKVSSWLLNLK